MRVGLRVVEYVRVIVYARVYVRVSVYVGVCENISVRVCCECERVIVNVRVRSMFVCV